jgi:two-component system, response regulator PdtaR
MNALRIAIADDERDIRDFLSRMLHLMGHQVTCVAENGRQLADACIASPPDLVITDVRMPVLDGIAAAAEILRHRAIPIIVLSARPVEGSIADLRSASAIVQMDKPINRADLQEAIEQVVRAPAVAAD